MKLSGIALRCDTNGNIVEILYNDAELGIEAQIGTPFTRLTAPGSLAKALSFLVDLRARGTAFDWEINLRAAGGVKFMRFVGGSLNGELFIAGAEDLGLARKIYEEMTRINNDQSSALRALAKDKSQDNALYDEISRLNNELVSIQRELSKKNAELETLNAEKNRFLGMAAHDLRNPLYSVISHSEILLETCDDPQDHKILEMIENASQFMAGLVDNLLDAARIEAGELRLDLSAVDAAALAQNNVALNRPIARRKNIRLDCVTEKLPSAVWDAAKIEQVLNNLLGNAIKYSETGSRVEVRAQSEGNGILLSVRDEGRGIAEEQKPRLFQPFQRGKKGTAGETSTGLGLAIVKRIVEGHGGNIRFESAPGQGTTFFVSLPLEPPREDADAPG